MNQPRQRLISDLARGLEPVRVRRVGVATALLSAAACLLVAAVVLGLLAPYRAGSLHQLVSAPRFLLETLLGVAALAALGAAGLALAVPAIGRPWRRAGPALALLAAWVGLHLYGLVEPALTPSMAGKRAGCDIEVVLVGLPLLAALLVHARRLWPLRGAWSGALLGLAAGAAPALLMQFACMYVPAHILLHHLLPAFVVGGVGLVAGYVLLRPR
ncbi:MAG: DUF1109 family protein [Gammaproteobacteria bacterium]|nr:DUF1109 family protein [Gammaproteobacteria bacterium]